MAVTYSPHDDEDECYPLSVDSGSEVVWLCLDLPTAHIRSAIGDGPDDAAVSFCACLDRDSVAALAGQLQAFLDRTHPARGRDA